ncbi:hypothetical protein QBC42DRAFT_10474 [Cladorrhinum samala]|uniref:Transmembrane protein n=1 Tax=Cladorrhinum samala TaxID=585594 RepID=A0AAV9HFW1_9PEZI|nr:hypothetical protein QBC42DRAFT_10474 [Cladorrhinum samala]
MVFLDLFSFIFFILYFGLEDHLQDIGYSEGREKRGYPVFIFVTTPFHSCFILLSSSLFIAFAGWGFGNTAIDNVIVYLITLFVGSSVRFIMYLAMSKCFFFFWYQTKSEDFWSGRVDCNASRHQLRE